MRPHLSRRVLAGVTSLAVGGVYVAASAMAALADSPSPSSITADVTTNPGGSVTVEVQGQESWPNKSCDPAKAGYAIAWGDKAQPGNLVARYNGEDIYVGTPTDNVVHPAGCGNGITFGPTSHTYAAAGDLPSKVCVVTYHTSTGTASGRHSFIAGGANHNTDNSIEENGGGDFVDCVDINAQKPDVTITKTATPTVKVGQNITYTILVNNDSSLATSDTLTVTDTLPAGVTYVSKSADADWSCSGTSTVTCTRTTALAGGDDSGTITILAKADGSVIGSIRNDTHVDNGLNNTGDDNQNNNDAHASTVVTTPTPDISIDKSATPEVLVGQDITYTMNVSNPGSDPTDHDIVMTDTLPAGTQFESIDPGNGWSCPNAGQSFTCTWTAALDPGDTTTDVVVLAKALDSAYPSVKNTAYVTMGNLSGNHSATTIVNLRSPDLTLEKSADPASGSTVSRGQQIDYTLHFANTGNGDANGVDISDVVPDDTSYVAGTATCSIACTATYDSASNTVHFALDIASGSDGTATFSVKVDMNAADGTVITNVGLLSHGGKKVYSNKVHHQVFVPVGDISLVKSVTPTKAKPGTVLDYTLVATASGNITQHNVVVTDAVPDGSTYKSADCAGSCYATYNASTDVVTWHLGDMNPGDTQSLAFSVTVNGPAADGTLPTFISNIGFVKSVETPKTPSNRVNVPVTAVLGKKIVKIITPPTQLPFTGLNSVQDGLLAMVLIGAGLVLITWPRLRPQSTQEA